MTVTPVATILEATPLGFVTALATLAAMLASAGLTAWFSQGRREDPVMHAFTVTFGITFCIFTAQILSESVLDMPPHLGEYARWRPAVVRTAHASALLYLLHALRKTPRG